jgi:pimeloyl-ACP methyl ester carboxylesterase
MQAFWSQPKCFHAMADHLATLERDGSAIARIHTPETIPVVVISSGNQPPEQLDAHRMLAEASDAGRHIIAARSAHWVQFDEPELVIDAVRELVIRRRDAS